MKLGIISPHPPLKGGISKESELLYPILKNIYKTKIYSYKKLYPEFLYPDSSQYDESYIKNTDNNIEFIIDILNPMTWRNTANNILKNNCTHLIIRFWNPFFIPLFSYLIRRVQKKNNKIRFYCICDNVFPHETLFIEKYLIKSFLKNFNGLMVMSLESKKILSSFVSSKLIINSFLPIKDNYDNKLSKTKSLDILNIRKPKLLLLFFGIIRNYKGLEIVLESLSRIKHNDIKLLIAGKCYINKQKYIQLINDYKLHEVVIWKDKYIPDSEIPLYFSAADALILSHRKIFQSGIIPLAYNFNKLVIASDLDSFKEHIINKKTGYLFENNNATSLEKIIEYVYNNHDFNSSTIFINEYKKKYSTDKIIDDYSNLLKL